MAEDAEKPQGSARPAPAPASRPPADRPAGSTQPRPPYAGQDRPGGGSRPPPRGGGRERRGRPRYFPRRKVCAFCVDHVTAIDYKNVDVLKRYMSDRARIDPRRKSGNCARHQRMLAHAMKRARHLALLPFSMDHILQSGIDVGGRRNY